MSSTPRPDLARAQALGIATTNPDGSARKTSDVFNDIAAKISQLQTASSLPPCLDIFYNKLLSNPTGVTEDLINAAFHADWESRPNPLDPTSKGPGAPALKIAIGVAFNTWTKNLKFDVQDLLDCGNGVYCVYSQVTGTCSGEEVEGLGGFLGMASDQCKGKPFKSFAIDVQKVVDGKIKQTYHIENWADVRSQVLSGAPVSSMRHAAIPDGAALTEVPKCVKTFYEKMLSNPPGVTAELAHSAFHDDWETRPNPLNPVEGKGPGPGALPILIGGAWGTQFKDLNWAIKEAHCSGDRVVVVGEVTAEATGKTPDGIPHFLGLTEEQLAGKKWKTLSIDIHKVVDGKIKQTVHLEDWVQCLPQIVQGAAPPLLDH